MTTAADDSLEYVFIERIDILCESSARHKKTDVLCEVN